MAPPPLLVGDEPDYDSCSSSTTRSGLSNLSSSTGSRRSSVSSSKPHKAHEAAWKAMHGLRTDLDGHIGLEHFRLLRRIGSGDIGNVYLCRLRSSAATPATAAGFYAMKVVDREAAAEKRKLGRAETEREILRMLDHPFLPTLYSEFEASHYSCLVTEFCPGGDLHVARHRQPGKRFSVSSAKFYAAEVVLALEYLHLMGIVYRDLKPENVLLRYDGHIMLSDFDLSFKCNDVVPMFLLHPKPTPKPNHKTPSCASSPFHPVLSCFLPTATTTANDDSDKSDGSKLEATTLVVEPTGARSQSFVGTHEYLAPEVISGLGHGAGVDWWTLGIFLYEMVFGATPFKGENNKKTLTNILKHPLRFPMLGVSSTREVEEMERVKDLIGGLLVKNPKKRMGSVNGAVEIKRHEFFKGVNWALIRSVRPPEVPKHTIRANYMPKLSKKEREEAYQLPNQHFDCF